MVKGRAPHVTEGNVWKRASRNRAVSKPQTTVNGVPKTTISQLNRAAAIDDIEIINLRVQERSTYNPTSWKPSRPPLAVTVEIKVEKGCTGFDSIIAKESEITAKTERKKPGKDKTKDTTEEKSPEKAIDYVTKVTAAMVKERDEREAMGEKAVTADVLEKTAAVAVVAVAAAATVSGRPKRGVKNVQSENIETAGADAVENTTLAMQSKTIETSSKSVEIATKTLPISSSTKAVVKRQTRNVLDVDKAEKPTPNTAIPSTAVPTATPTVTKVTAAMVRERAARDSLNGPVHRILMRMTSSPSGSRSSLGTEVENGVWTEGVIERRQREEGKGEGEMNKEASSRSSVQPTAKRTAVFVQSSTTGANTSGTSSSSSSSTSNLNSSISSSMNSNCVEVMRRKTILANVASPAKETAESLALPESTVLEDIELRPDTVDTVDLTRSSLEVENEENAKNPENAEIAEMGRRSRRLRSVADKKEKIENEKSEKFPKEIMRMSVEELVREEDEMKRVEETERDESERRGKERRERLERRESEKSDGERTKRIALERKESHNKCVLKRANIRRRKVEEAEREDREREERRVRRDGEDDREEAIQMRERLEMEEQEVCPMILYSLTVIDTCFSPNLRLNCLVFLNAFDGQ
jgi:hypothetical protein